MAVLRRLATELDSQVLLISSMTLVIMLGSSVISPVLPLPAQEFGVSYAGAGALVSAFAVGRIPSNFPSRPALCLRRHGDLVSEELTGQRPLC
ncbi:MAG: hypothetical protein HYZ72_02910 [Deltaproteobacteria bacterium]|nr:hypothetical protein [Deltaproteobacteria bacterium]